MAKLTIARMSDATKIKQIDNLHSQLEESLETILGIQDNTEISAPIFGTSPDGTSSIQPDGGIRGVPRLKSDGVQSDAGLAVGIEFLDGAVRKKIAYVDSKITLHEYDDATATWSQVADLENPGAGSGKLVDLSDVNITDDPLPEGKVLKVSGGEFVLADPTVVDAITSFTQLTDTPAAYAPGTFSFAPADVGKLVYVASQNMLGFTAAPAASQPAWAMAIKASTISNWGNNSWIEAYQWIYDNGSSTLLVSDAALITDDLTVPAAPKLSKYITLEQGIYDVSLWYTCASPSKYGWRAWKVQGQTATVTGPAVNGGTDRAPTFLDTNGNLIANNNLQEHYLGTRTLAVDLPGKIKFLVYQNSGAALSVTFYATIIKVK